MTQVNYTVDAKIMKTTTPVAILKRANEELKTRKFIIDVELQYGEITVTFASRAAEISQRRVNLAAVAAEWEQRTDEFTEILCDYIGTRAGEDNVLGFIYREDDEPLAVNCQSLNNGMNLYYIDVLDDFFILPPVVIDLFERVADNKKKARVAKIPAECKLVKSVNLKSNIVKLEDGEDNQYINLTSFKQLIQKLDTKEARTPFTKMNGLSVFEAVYVHHFPGYYIVSGILPNGKSRTAVFDYEGYSKIATKMPRDAMHTYNCALNSKFLMSDISNWHANVITGYSTANDGISVKSVRYGIPTLTFVADIEDYVNEHPYLFGGAGVLRTLGAGKTYDAATLLEMGESGALVSFKSKAQDGVSVHLKTKELMEKYLDRIHAANIPLTIFKL